MRRAADLCRDMGRDALAEACSRAIGELAAQRDEIERLRAALARIEARCGPPVFSIAADIRAIARAALQAERAPAELPVRPPPCLCGMGPDPSTWRPCPLHDLERAP